MKTFLYAVKNNIVWLIILVIIDAFFIVGMWATDAAAMKKISLATILFSLIIFAVACIYSVYRENKLKKSFTLFLDYPSKENLDSLKAETGHSYDETVDRLYSTLTEYNGTVSSLAASLEDHEEYTESWAHEIKTPISLMTLLLDNHDFEPDLKYKMEYIRCRLNESVEQMLQYARIKSTRKDFLFEKLKLKDVINEVVQDYEPLLSEKDFLTINKVREEVVTADRRAMKYMLGQFVSNSIKYAKEDPELIFSFENNKLVISDNGIGVKPADLPFVFEKGFTGDTGELRGKATGMGLYLASKIAENNKIGIEAKPSENGGFQIELTFPEV